MTKTKEIQIETKQQFELVDVTDHVRKAISDSGVREGVAHISSPHSTAAIRLNHKEPLLVQDFMRTLYRLVPIDGSYSHDLFELRQKVAPNERSNGHAHVKAFLLGSSESVAVSKGELLLGEHQSIFFVELDGGRRRRLLVTVSG